MPSILRGSTGREPDLPLAPRPAPKVMHVLIVSHYLLPHVGGIEVLVDELAAHLRETGHTVTLVSSAVDAPGGEDVAGVHRVPAWNFLEKTLNVPFPIFSPSILPTMRKAVRSADVVHAHGVLYLSSLLALLFSWWYSKPLVVTEHVGFVRYKSRALNLLEQAALRLLTPLFLRQAQAVIAFNRRVYDWLSSFQIHPERLSFTVNGIDICKFSPAAEEEQQAARRQLGLDTDAILALFVGRFVEKKRPSLMLESGDTSFDILMCGNGNPPTIDSESTVHTLRNIDHDRMPLVYRAADVMVMPSQGEGFPLAIMEAMACGLPVVACEDPAYDDYARGDELAQVPPRCEAIRQAVRSIAEDPREHSRRAKAARLRAVTDYSLQRYAEQHLDIYRAASQAIGLNRELRPLGFDLATQLKLPALRSLVRRPDRRPRIDVGPGTGYLANALLSPGPIVVVDIAHDNLVALRQRAREAGATERFLPVRADLMYLPFKDDASSTVLCTQVLEHVVEDKRAASELVRILASTGQLIIEVPHIGAGYASHLELLGVRTVHDVPGPEFHCRPGYTRASLSEIFEGTEVKMQQSKVSIGRLGMVAIDAVSLVHLAYQKLRYGRTSWTWADVGEMTNSPIMRIYRLLFPVFRLLDLLDRLVGGHNSFIIAARFEKTDSPPEP